MLTSVTLQAGQVLDPVDDVAAHRFGELRDRVAVLDGHREVHGRFFLTDLDGDSAGIVPGRAARDALEEAADGSGGAAAHLHLLDLLGRDAGDLGDHRVADGGRAALALEGGPSRLRRVRFSLTVYPLLEGYSTFMRETPRP